jgi:large subunit ribosomal protein LP1
MTSVEHIACVYSSLLLHDSNLPVTEKNINAILKASNVKVESYWPGLFASYVGKVDLDAIISNIGGSSSSSSASTTQEAPKEVKKEEKGKKEEKEEKKKSEEESGGDMGFGLFGGEEE